MDTEAEIKPASGRPANFLDAVLFVLLLLFFEIVLQVVTRFAIHVGSRGSVFWAVERFISFCVVYLIIRKRLGGRFGDYVGRLPAPITVYVLVIAGVLGIHLLVEPIDGFLRGNVPFYELYGDSYHPYDIEGTILRSIIVAPAIEEFLFRGVIMRGFSRNYSLWSALFLSSLLFALHHHNPAQLIGPFCSGVLFGAALIRSNSIVPCLFGHVLTNWIWFIARANGDAKELLSIGTSGDGPALLAIRMVLGLGLAAASISLFLLPWLEANKRKQSPQHSFR